MIRRRSTKQIEYRTCYQCSTRFIPERPEQDTCSRSCAAKQGHRKAVEEEVERLLALKPLEPR